MRGGTTATKLTCLALTATLTLPKHPARADNPEAGDVAGEDLLAVEPNGPGPLQPGPLRIEFRGVIRPVLRGTPERKEWNDTSRDP